MGLPFALFQPQKSVVILGPPTYKWFSGPILDAQRCLLTKDVLFWNCDSTSRTLRGKKVPNPF